MSAESQPQGDSCESLAEFFANKRREAKLKMAEVAKACGISRSFLCDVEHGRRGLTLTTAIRIAACLDVSPDEVVSRLDESKDAADYNVYVRVLRSNERASQVARHMKLAAMHIETLKQALKSQKTSLKVVQELETTLEMLNDVLAYKNERPKRWAVACRARTPRSREKTPSS